MSFEEPYDVYNNKIEYIFRIGNALKLMNNKLSEMEENINTSIDAIKKYDEIKATTKAISTMVIPLSLKVKKVSNDVNEILNDTFFNVNNLLNMSSDFINFMEKINIIDVKISNNDGETFIDNPEKLYVQSYNTIYINVLNTFINNNIVDNKLTIKKYKTDLMTDFVDITDETNITITSDIHTIYLICENETI